MSSRRSFCVITSVLFLIQSHSFSAQAASFDCKKATTTAEKLICSNTSLSLLDEELAKIYLQTLASVPDREALKREQRDWVKKKRNLCSSIDCLSSSYRTRISSLTKELKSSGNVSTVSGISGTWQELKPAAGGPFSLIIDRDKLRLTLCKKRTFKLQGVRENKYIFTAREKGRCPGYSNRGEFNMITISITDEETIHARFYSGSAEKNFLGSDNFFNLDPR